MTNQFKTKTPTRWLFGLFFWKCALRMALNKNEYTGMSLIISAKQNWTWWALIYTVMVERVSDHIHTERNNILRNKCYVIIIITYYQFLCLYFLYECVCLCLFHVCVYVCVCVCLCVWCVCYCCITHGENGM